MAKYEQIAEELMREILNGKISNPLPPERSLAQRFEVSYATMRNAIGELVDRGILSREHGRGVFIKTPERTGEQTMALGFVVPERVWTENGIRAPFYSSVFSGALGEAQKHGYHLIMDCHAGNLMPLEGKRKVDAIMAACPDDLAEFNSVSRFLPVMILGHNYPNSNYPAVYIDDFRAAHEAVTYLIKTGHRRIAHLYGPKENWSFYQRLCGYRKALEDAGIAISGDNEFGPREMLEKLTDNRSDLNPITAIFCHNDGSAYDLINTMNALCLRTPEDISVIGFDDLVYSAVWNPPLSSVANPQLELGRRGVQKTIQLLNNQLRGEEFREELDCKLIIRKTTARRK